jgi:hypothetical protein
MITDTLTHYLQAFGDTTRRVESSGSCSRSLIARPAEPLSTAGLVIKAGGSALAKSGGKRLLPLANGILQKITAATDMPALVRDCHQRQVQCVLLLYRLCGDQDLADGYCGHDAGSVKFPQLPIRQRR